jgi:hypothetical protein
MKIVADFKDFYDIGMSLGHDHELLYIRKRERIAANYYFKRFNINSGYNNKYKNVTNATYIVGFCGKVYPILYFVSYKDAYQHKWVSAEDNAKNKKDYSNAFCFDSKDVDKFLEKHLNKDTYELYCKGNKSKWTRYSSCMKDSVAKYFQEFDEQQNEFKHIFEEIKAPIFLMDYHDYSQNKMIVNACLKDVEFAKKIDPYTAYQELTAYLSNIAKPEPFVPVPSDKDMVEIKGFDKKWSFRKKPTKGI